MIRTALRLAFAFAGLVTAILLGMSLVESGREFGWW